MSPGASVWLSLGLTVPVFATGQALMLADTSPNLYWSGIALMAASALPTELPYYLVGDVAHGVGLAFLRFGAGVLGWLIGVWIDSAVDSEFPVSLVCLDVALAGFLAWEEYDIYTTVASE